MGGKSLSSASRKKVSSNMVWRLLERCGAQGVSFIVSIVLARLLDPSVYGTIALVLVFTTILQVFVDSGLGNALIQKKDADDLDFSSVFYFNIVFCLILYFGIFAFAPIIAKFYSRQSLRSLLLQDLKEYTPFVYTPANRRDFYRYFPHQIKCF